MNRVLIGKKKKGIYGIWWFYLFIYSFKIYSINDCPQLIGIKCMALMITIIIITVFFNMCENKKKKKLKEEKNYFW